MAAAEQGADLSVQNQEAFVPEAGGPLLATANEDTSPTATVAESVYDAETTNLRLAFPSYASLDPNSAEAITFDGATVSWNGKTWTLGTNTIFLDWRLTDAQLAASNGHAFRSLQDAKWGTTLTMGTPETTDDIVIPKGLVNGTDASRMTILTAPGVYWVDNPDDNNNRPLRDANDPETKDTATMSNATPIGMTLTTNYLYFYGLSSDYSKVVYASARGQQAGANGNFTMFNLTGTGGVWTDNVTFANYTNLDLNFPLNREAQAWTSVNPTLAANILGLKDGGFSRPMRSDTRTQAQLFMGANASGRGGISINSAFMSLHNMLALGQAVMINCYVVAGGHSGNPSIYMNSELHFYMTNFNSGTQFYNSDIYVDPFEVSVNGLAAADTYISGLSDATDVNNAVMVDTRIHRGNRLLNGTSANPAPQGGFQALFNWAGKGPMNPASRNYQSNVTFDGAPYLVQEAITPGVAIDMTGDLLKAYKLESNGKAYYNVQNILGTNYPAIASKIAEAALDEKNSNLDQNMYNSLAGGTNYNTIATNATLTRSGSGNLRKGSGANATTTLTAGVPTGKTDPGDWEFSAYTYTHEATGINKATSTLITGTDVISLESTGTDTATVTANLTGITDDVKLYVIAKSASLGIARGIALTVEAEYQETPVLAEGASLLDPVDGVAKVNYAITGFTGTGAQAGLLDRTVVDWFRVDAANPAVRTPVAVSRDGSGPVKDYAVNEGDIGYYLQAEISPKYNHSAVGAKTILTMTRVITAADVKIHYWTDTINNGFTATSGKEVIWYDQPLLANIPTDNQNTAIPGTMMVVNGWRNDPKGGSNNTVTWNFSGIEPKGGASGNAGPAAATSRLFYVPPKSSGKFGDMIEEVGLVSSKSGAGFGSSPSFLDIYIKADTLNNPEPNSYMRQNKDNRAYSPGIKNGYGLRIQRMDNANGISKYALEGSNTGGAGAGSAVFLMKFNNGEAYADPASSLGTDFGTKLDQTITDLQTDVTYPKGPRGAMSSVYDGVEGMVDDVRITISMIQKPDDPTKGILTAIVYANDAQDGVTLGGEAYGYMSHLKLEAEVDWNDFGGFGTTYASSTNAPNSLNTANINSAMYTSWRAEAVKVVDVTNRRPHRSSGGSTTTPATPTVPTPPIEPTPTETEPSKPSANPGTQPSSEGKNFTDVAINDSWAQEAIEFLASKGIIQGTSDTTFDPGKNITRADFITLLVRALDMKAEFSSNFDDVSSSDYYYQALGIAKQLGIASGVGDNLFNPKQEISRQDMMVLCARALQLSEKLKLTGNSSDLASYSDKGSVASYAEEGVASMVHEGIIEGNGAGLNPIGNATRAETAVIIFRILKKL
ncbi:S-layer homology domain-containing protein [Paenibacillus sp. TAB 01]|uniref:S-layer homology domain-containing protein n=1 Tax=Paenibacillus sp. TAB 01 TaxID=3368988 RepID=UPI003753A680